MADRLSILRHALGVGDDGRGAVYRNHFVTGEGSTDHDDCMALVADGLMRRYAGNALTGEMDLFTVTEAGKQHVEANRPAPEKLTRSQRRYRAWLNAESGLPFIAWLRSHPTPEATRHE